MPTDDPFQIDPHALHTELLRQPGLTRDAGTREADARHAHDQAKARLAVVTARLSLAVRRDPGRYHLRDRPNQDEIDAAVLLQSEHQEAVEAVADARYALDIHTAHGVAMVDRRKALEGLVRLLELDYYAEREPRVSAATRDEVDRQALRRERGSGDEVTDF
jgi:hypothetical protein